MNSKEGQSPLTQAQLARQQIEQALENQTPLKLQLSPPIAACILGLPKKAFENYGFSTLIHSDEKGVNFLVAGNQDVALQAFQNWQQDQNPKIASLFQKTQYLALYRLIQAIKINQGSQAIKGIEGLILKLLEEEDNRFQGMTEIIAKNNLPDEDLVILHQLLTQIWDNLPRGIRSTIASCSPENVFK